MPKTCIVVSHTHWDREWYEPFQRFRMRLVRLVDKLLHILDSDPDYRHFMLDGQTIVLQDYLQIRPERATTLRGYVEDGRLLIGPWYVLPDEFLVSGEALVRNLLLGDCSARELGPKVMVGYTPDAFGHISQLPQILRGFGIDSAAACRGLDDQPTELLWQAPDGSTVLMCNLRTGYDNAGRLPVLDREAFAAELTRLCERLAPHAVTEYILLMNGADHMEPTPELPAALAAARELLPDMQLVHGTLPLFVDAVRQSLSQSGQRLQTVEGELRSPKRHPVLPGVLSARMWIKQRNAQVQNLLEKWAEPFAALAALVHPADGPLSGPPAAHALIWQAWKYLLENHPHDSICGCGVDQTHREMVIRFDWAEQMAEEITRQSLASIANQVDTTPPGQAALSIPLVVFNPLAHARTDLVSTGVQVPGSLEDFELTDMQGQSVPHHVVGRTSAEFASLQLGREEILGLATMVQMVATLGLAVQEIHVATHGATADVDVTLIEHGQTDPAVIAAAQEQLQGILTEGKVQSFAVRAHRAATLEFRFVAHAVPGCGFKTYFLAEKGEQTLHAAPAGANSADAVGLAEGAAVDFHMENVFLAVDVDPATGTVTLHDKSTGAAFAGLHRFVSAGDRGDLYNYCPPETDTLVDAPAAIQVSWIERGPACSAVQVKQTYQIPASLTADRQARRQEMVEVPITTEVRLCQGVPRLDFRTEVDNRACDHRLRVHFPTWLHTDCSQAEGTFDVLRRPLDVPQDTADWVEQPAPTHPQQSFVDVSDGTVGLMVINRGLPEYEVLREGDGCATVALTLLRCVGWLSRDDFPARKGHAGPALETPEGQCPGHHVFEYAIVPHANGWENAYAQAHAFNAPLRATTTSQHSGILPPAESLVHLQGDGLVLSAVKGAECGDGLVVRFYNITDTPTTARLKTSVPIRCAALVDLAEEAQLDLPVLRSGLAVEVKGKQIVTAKLGF